MKKVLFMFTGILILVACKKNVDTTPDPNNPPPPVVVATDTAINHFGADSTTQAERQWVPYVEDVDSSIFPIFGRVTSLPTSWSIAMPTPDDQGDFESCVGWAIGYGMLSYQYRVVNGYSDYTKDRLFSPSFIWNKLNGGSNKPIDYIKALQLIKDDGDCRWPYMPGDIKSITEQPSAAAIANAAEFKITDFMQFRTFDIDKLKSFIHKNYVIPIRVLVGQGLGNGTGAPDFAKINGQQVWVNNTPPVNNAHALLICGYDDDLHAFKAMNSWKPTWSNKGFAWIDYTFFQSVVTDAYIVITNRPGTIYTVPIVRTLPVGSVANDEAAGGGAISSDGGTVVTIGGVCWSTSPHPTVANNKTTDIAGVGHFTSSLTGLLSGTTYYVRAYATNSTGTGYGDEVSFTTTGHAQGPTVTDIDGNIYHTVTIGKQTWMVENLRVTKYNNGVAISQVTDAVQWRNLTTGGWCNYNNDAGNDAIYGKLYNWAAANGGDIAPVGWHIASLSEWFTLSDTLDDQFNPSYAMKSSSLWHTGIEGDNSSGFTALPGGFRNGDGSYGGLAYSAYWWCADNDPFIVDYAGLDYSSQLLTDPLGGVAETGFSIRCVKN